MERKYIPPRLVDCNGDLTGAWYIIYRVFDTKAGRYQRFRITKGFRDLPTAEERYKWAEQLMKKINAKLQDTSFDPFLQNEVVITDEIGYEGKAKVRVATYDITHFINLYFSEHRSNLRKKSVQTYQSKVRVFTQWLEEHNLIYNHPKFFMAKWVTDFTTYLRAEKKVSNRTHNSYIQTLFSIWQWFIKMNFADTNPWSRADRLKYMSTSKRPFTKEQSKRIMERLAAMDPWLQFFCEFQYHLLTRPCSEQIRVKLDYIDWQHQTLKIPGHISKNHKTQLVAIPNVLFEKMLRMGLQDMPKGHYIFGKFGPSEIPASRDYFSKTFRKHLDALGIGKDWSMYSWKHTMNQRAAMKGIPIKEMQMQNRHHSLDQYDQYLKGLTVLDGKNLFDNLPEI